MSQQIWKNSKQHVFYADDVSRPDWECEVRLGDGQIEVSYLNDEGQRVRYVGTEVGTGHFELRAPDVEGRATLHMFKDTRLLDGYWTEQRGYGMWRIVLA